MLCNKTMFNNLKIILKKIERIYIIMFYRINQEICVNQLIAKDSIFFTFYKLKLWKFESEVFGSCATFSSDIFHISEKPVNINSNERFEIGINDSFSVYPQKESTFNCFP